MKIEKMDSEDKKLFEEMYLEYEVYLRRIAYVNDIPVDYIEDVVQDTFVSYARYKLDEEAYNSEEYPAHDKAANLPDYVVSKERCEAIIKEIERMPENWRQVATLRLIEGRPTREVCAMLDITEKACYSRVSRIRKYLEELLKRDNWP